MPQETADDTETTEEMTGEDDEETFADDDDEAGTDGEEEEGEEEQEEEETEEEEEEEEEKEEGKEEEEDRAKDDTKPGQKKEKPPAEKKAEAEESKRVEETEPKSDYDDDFEVDLELQVNGKKSVETVPLKRLARSYQMERASQERFQDASKKERLAVTFFDHFRKDPIGLLIDHYTREGGGDMVAHEKAVQYVVSLCDSVSAQALAEVGLPEHEKQLRKAQREIQFLEARKRQIEDEARQRDEGARLESLRQTRHREIAQASEALKEQVATSGYKVGPEFTTFIDRRMWEMEDRGFKNYTAEEAIRDVLREREAYLKGEYLMKASPEEILRLRPDLRQAAQTRSLQEVKTRQAKKVRSAPEKSDRRKKVFFGWDELEEDIRREEREKQKA